MMKMFKTFSALSVVITVISIGATGCYQPDIPKENILPDVAIEIEEKIKGLYSWNPLKRRNAVVQLGQMNARALGYLKDPHTVEPLIAALKYERLIVRVKSAYALYEITGTDLGRSTEKWQEWWGKNKQNILKSR